MEDFIRLLQQECSYVPETQNLRMLLTHGETKKFGRKGVIIETGRVDENVYIVREGIIRFHYFSGDRENTFGFGVRGTVFLSPMGYYMRRPSFMAVSACVPTTLTVISKTEMMKVMAENIDIERWFLHLWMNQLAYCEKKLEVINGCAQERYESFLKHRPEIIQAVPLNIIASYLGVSPETLSRIRKRMTDEKSNK